MWNKGALEEYLNTCAVPGDVIKSLWDYIQNINPLACANDRPLTAEDIKTIKPHIWSVSLPMDTWVDAGMHLSLIHI